jgi:thymidylate synthase ThyX
MGFFAKILADSVNEVGVRLTTIEATYPRIIHSELLTHRALSRSSASSRAIPVPKLIQRVMDDPFVPEHIGKNQRGMQASEQLTESERAEAVAEWLKARDSAVKHAEYMVSLGVHKQVVNRLIEPWMWITVIYTATDWNNFWALRIHEAAEPHFQHIAGMMYVEMRDSKPVLKKTGEWHLPLIFDEDREILSHLDMSKGDVETMLVKISVGRCARVSYLTHDGRRDHSEDIRLHDDLLVKVPKHSAPGEHVAQALDSDKRVANLRGWRSHRMMTPNESVPG